MYKKQILKNGLTILKVPVKGAHSVLLDVFVKVGSRQETPQINGISHFLEHLFFKGSAKYPTAQDLSHALDEIGAEYNANTGKEHTQYYIKAAKKHLPFIFDVLTDMLQRPAFAEAEIEREKGVIIEEINMYEDTPMRHVEDVLEEVMWPDQPLGRNIAGTKDVIRKIKRRDFLDYVSAYYQPQNMILAVSGAYDERALDKMIAQMWGRVKNQRSPRWRKAVEKQTVPSIQIAPKKTEQLHLALGFRSYDYNHPSYITQLVLATILGGGMSSRLFDEIREKRGLAYYVKAAPSNYQDTGLFVIQAGVRQGSLTESIKVIISELKRIRDVSVPDRELNKAREYIKGTLTLSLEDSEALLGWYLDQIAFRHKVLEPDEAFAAVDKVTAEAIQKLAKDIFQSSKLNLAVVGTGNTRDIKKLLRF